MAKFPWRRFEHVPRHAEQLFLDDVGSANQRAGHHHSVAASTGSRSCQSMLTVFVRIVDIPQQ